MKTSLLVLLSFLSLSFSAIATENLNQQKTNISQQEQQIDLNKADLASLAKSIKGIGPKRAASIIAYREKNGPFKSIDDLAEVKGLGKSFVKKNHVALEKKFRVN